MIERKEPNRRAAKAIIGGSIVAMLLLIAAPFVFLFGNGCGMVEESIRAQATSPNGKYTAVLLKRGGDATVGFFRMVAVCEGSGSCTADGENVVASDESQGIFNVGWIGNDKLIVYYSPSFTKFRGMENAYKGVKIEYVPQGK